MPLPEKGAARHSIRPLMEYGFADTPTALPNGALLERLLETQADLSAAEQFAHWHDRTEEPTQVANVYKERMPLSLPGAGEQYAFEVDLDSCTGCKACVTACHSLNGLDEDESWRQVGLLLGTSNSGAVQQHVTTACHHCEDPACLLGCPVQAYEKDGITGIVRHLDDQCIGCQYCVMMCPYEVPQYSEKRGIVRKCDMCHGRLSAGEAPACVQACPSQAIAIRLVPRVGGRIGVVLPAAPDPDCSRPTTHYVSTRTDDVALLPIDALRLDPAPAHHPLAAMLTLTQGAVGLLSGAVIAGDWAGMIGPGPTRWTASAGFGLLLLGLMTSAAHLGQPRKAWRVFLGLRTSWLSREAVAFGSLAAVASLYVAAQWLVPSDRHSLNLLGPLVLGLGVISIACSARIYVATRREFWKWNRTALQFFSTTLMFAALAVLRAGADSAIAQRSAGALLIAVALLKLCGVAALLRGRGTGMSDALERSRRLLRGALLRLTAWRIATLLLGGIVLPLALLLFPLSPLITAAALISCAVGEWIERHLFFAAVAPARMPGRF